MAENREMENKTNIRHPKMPVEQRAKQFMPFAAVAGLEEALREKEQEVGTDYGIINQNVHNEKYTEE